MNIDVMSYHNHPLRQTYTLENSPNPRKPSTASTTSSTTCSNSSSAFEIFRTSTHSSNSSRTSGHKRRVSESRDISATVNGYRSSSPEFVPTRPYKSIRDSFCSILKTPSSPILSHEATANQNRVRSLGFQERSSPSSIKFSSTRNNSLILSRANSISRSPNSPRIHSTQSLHSHISAPDFNQLQKSSTSQLRTLSKFAKNVTSEEFNMLSPTQEVTGLHGRRRLQRSDTIKGNSALSLDKGLYSRWESRNWMDNQRQFLQAYEYLCHIGEAKEWMEDILRKSIPPIVQLEEALRDGVTLAEIVVALKFDKKIRIFRHPKLQYRHSDNIAIFFRFLAEVELPDLFRFELTDLYEKKNTPKVIYCIHALSWLLYRKGIVDFQIGNLLGQLEFEHHELEEMQKGLDKAGVSMPSFGNMSADFGLSSINEPGPTESEEDRTNRELEESSLIIIDLQAQARGALVRLRLGKLMQGLWDAEDVFVDLQSLIRGDFSRQVYEYRSSMRKFAINLQSGARGFLIRRLLSKYDLDWKKNEKSVNRLQSFIRANKIRDGLYIIKSKLMNPNLGTEDLQASIRGWLLRKNLNAQQNQTKIYSGSVKLMQAAIRGMVSRKARKKQLQILDGEKNTVSLIQAAIRGMVSRKARKKQLQILDGEKNTVSLIQASIRAAQVRSDLHRRRRLLEAESSMLSTIQAAFRGNQFRLQYHSIIEELKNNALCIINLQSLIRASLIRHDTHQNLQALSFEESSTIQIQTLIRGMLLRKRVGNENETLFNLASQISKFQASAKGFSQRYKIKLTIENLQKYGDEVSRLQALSRGICFRNDLGLLLAELEEEEESITAFQVVAKASLIRSKFEAKLRFFKSNMEKVVKIQSFVRSKIQGEAYKSLTTGKNPPVNTVKNFVHLLNDSDFDFNEEIEFERLRKIVVQQVRQNEMAEQYIDQLDIKIALLVKNKITLDEVVKHQKNFGGHAGNLLVNTTMAASSNQSDLKALNKNSRKKLELYQQLFFTLQTQPQYLARLFKRIREQGTAEKDCRRIETLIMVLFGYAQKRREEYYLIKLITRSAKEEVDGVASINDYLRGNFFWTKVLANYTRSPRDRKFLRELLGPLIQISIIGDPTLDLESDPMQIYRSAINNEELRTGQPSRRLLDIPREEAIKDPETRDLFISHLRDLREIVDEFLVALELQLHKMPYGIRFVCRKIFDALCERFSEEPQQLLLQIVGNWLWRFYLQPALLAPELMGVVEKQLTPLQKRNLGEIAKVLNQVSSCRLFGGENIYLQPLNAYVGDATQKISLIFSEIISVPDAENTFDIDEFNDLYAKVKPTLYIKMDDIFAIHHLIATDLGYICSSRDDTLREIIQELGSAESNENEMLGVSSTEIQMNLNPKLHDIDDPEAEVKTLFMETKRCILYIIRVQTGSNLMDILVRPVTLEDEIKWCSVLREEFSEDNKTRGAYSDANTLVDIKAMTYKDLKRTALENIMKLEQLGRISRQNFYQDILNAIALDIRTKSRRRAQRHRELEAVRLTLANLNEKAEWLESQRRSYDNYIEQAMMTLQKKGRKRFLMPFTKQYNHERELERSGRKPKFGSFKYSAHTLFDKGVLVSWKGHTDRDWDKTNLTISCDEVGIFFIEGSKGSVQIPGASAEVPMDSLLAAQFANHQYMDLFEGTMRLNVNLFLHLLYKKFYRTDG